MKTILILFCLLCAFRLQLIAQGTTTEIPRMPDPAARKASMEAEWAALQQSPPRLGVRDCFLFLLDALDTRFLTGQQTEWVLKLVQTRVVADKKARSYGIVEVSVSTPSGKLGVKADLVTKKRLAYHNPKPLPNEFLFTADGLEIGKPILEKYKSKSLKTNQLNSAR